MSSVLHLSNLKKKGNGLWYIGCTDFRGVIHDHSVISLYVVVKYKWSSGRNQWNLFLFWNHAMWKYRTGGRKHHRLGFIYTEGKRTRKRCLAQAAS